MGELILVVILPAFVVLTVFLFNIGTKEKIDVKYGLNTYYFKPIAAIIVSMYFGCSYFGLLIGKDFTDDCIELNQTVADLFVGIIVLGILYFLTQHKFNNKWDEIYKGRNQYKPEKKMKYIIITVLSFLLIICSSFLTFKASYASVKSAAKILLRGPIGNQHLLILGLFMILFICYAMTILAAGYIFNYGQLISFGKYRLVITDELRKIFKELGIIINQEFADVYILAETEEDMIMKVCGIDFSAITIKKEHIRNISFIDEVKSHDSQSIINSNSGRKGGVEMKKIILHLKMFLECGSYLASIVLGIAAIILTISYKDNNIMIARQNLYDIYEEKYISYTDSEGSEEMVSRLLELPEFFEKNKTEFLRYASPETQYYYHELVVFLYASFESGEKNLQTDEVSYRFLYLLESMKKDYLQADYDIDLRPVVLTKFNSDKDKINIELMKKIKYKVDTE